MFLENSTAVGNFKVTQKTLSSNFRYYETENPIEPVKRKVNQVAISNLSW